MRALPLALMLTACGPAEDGAATAAAETPAEEHARVVDAARPVELAPAAEGRWLRLEEPLTWAEARDQAPEGCHLPARWELVKGFDDGDFERINTWAWTASEIDDDSAWLVLFSNLLLDYPESRATKVHRLTKNYVIYRCEVSQ